MPIGPGKYGAVCTVAREATQAEAVVLIVINGQLGSGFSVQADPIVSAKLPELLRLLADSIDRSFGHT